MKRIVYSDPPSARMDSDLRHTRVGNNYMKQTKASVGGFPFGDHPLELERCMAPAHRTHREVETIQSLREIKRGTLPRHFPELPPQAEGVV